MRRVVITGIGAITPLGLSADSFWEGLEAGRCAIAPLEKFDTGAFRVKLAAEVKDFKPEDFMDGKAAKRMERFSQFALAASKEALTQSGLDLQAENPYRIGVSIGSGIGSLQVAEQNEDRLRERGPGRCDPLMIPRMISNMAAGNVSIAFGLKGKCINVVTACASGTHSIGEAYRSIAFGDAEAMVCGGAEACITPLAIAGFQALTALSTATDPARASIPFDKDRDGFVMGEGAGVLVLEELAHARARGAVILAEVLGYGATSDAYHITSPAEDGEGAAEAMRQALREAGIRPEQLSYINAHGTSTHHNDLFETKAIRAALGAAADKVPVSSTKSMIGHLLGAAGAVELVACVKSIQAGFIHATVGLQEAGEGCDLDYVTGSGRHRALQYVLSNSLGFGGHNASLLIGKYEE